MVAKKKFKEHEMNNRVVTNMNFYQKISMPCDEDLVCVVRSLISEFQKDDA